LLLIVSLIAEAVHLDSLQSLDRVFKDSTISPVKSEVLLATKSTLDYAVEGCFSSFDFADSVEFHEDNSNIRCQETCRDKGYVLAGTKGSKCCCGNNWPKNLNVPDDECRQTCRKWGSCHSVQSCCGGSNAYTISAVGNLDVGKQVLKRLSHAWQTQQEYYNYMIRKLPQQTPKGKVADWRDSFNDAGFSYCDSAGRSYMTGLWRTGGDNAGIESIEYASCLEAAGHLHVGKDETPNCVTQNWMYAFDKPGWVSCNAGYYMVGLERNAKKHREIFAIERARCCKPRSQPVNKWGHCYNQRQFFNNQGWHKCNKGYYMVGMRRSECNWLQCIEEFKCCKMGEYMKGTWRSKPTFSINIKDVKGNLKHCSMNAMDNTPDSTSYKCTVLSKPENMLILNAVKFKSEGSTTINAAEPKPIKNFRPVTCSASDTPYTCTKTLSTTISSETSFTIGTGFSMSVTIGASMEYESKFLGAGSKIGFNLEVSGSTEFNTERSKSTTHEVSDETEVSLDVPANKTMKIDMMRSKEDLEYKWMADFQLLGKYQTNWSHVSGALSGVVLEWQDISTVLSGVDSHLYAFGTWKYPGIDTVMVIVTDEHGKKVANDCEHESTSNATCHIKT